VLASDDDPAECARALVRRAVNDGVATMSLIGGRCEIRRASRQKSLRGGARGRRTDGCPQGEPTVIRATSISRCVRCPIVPRYLLAGMAGGFGDALASRSNRWPRPSIEASGTGLGVFARTPQPVGFACQPRPRDIRIDAHARALAGASLPAGGRLSRAPEWRAEKLGLARMNLSVPVVVARAALLHQLEPNGVEDAEGAGKTAA
jgi:hypothetical protein